MNREDVPAVAGLQALAFPPPFSEDLHWDHEHLEAHIDLFPCGQFVAVVDAEIVGSCSNAIIAEAAWQAHSNWGKTLGGPFLYGHRQDGTTLYGVDITVHPKFRRIGVGRAFYQTRFHFVKTHQLFRYGTGCRMPDYRNYTVDNPSTTIETYANRVVSGETQDRTLTPLLKYGLRFLQVIPNYMEDLESANSAALLEWIP